MNTLRTGCQWAGAEPKGAGRDTILTGGASPLRLSRSRPGRGSMETKPRISVFFPMHNEEDNVRRTVGDAVAALERLASEFEIIVVNDGSADGTGEIAAELAAADARIRVVVHPRNRGYGAALRSGIGAARLDLVAFADGDGQFDMRELGSLLEALPGNDMAIGYRIRRADPWHRTLNARAWGVLIGILFGVRPRDLDCGFKLFRRNAVQGLELESEGAFISTELLAKAKRADLKIAQVGVHHYPRRAGASTGNSPAVVAKAFRELVAFRRRLR